MNDWQLKTPVALIIFNRPDTTEKVFEAIRQVKPPKLLVIADAPRANRPGEAEKCAAVRAIIDRVDWDCELLKNYSDVNLGCGLRPATGISWVFEQVEEAIILEHDCLPHPTFFRFCEELLEKYRNEPRIMNISAGNKDNFLNFLFGSKLSGYSYYFSRYFGTWGWASWRRAWQYYDFEMKRFPEILEQGWLNKFFQDERTTQYWIKRFEQTYNLGNTWDYQWEFACWLQNGLSIRPKVNLISNIGSGPEAVNTKDEYDPSMNRAIRALSFPLKHPPSIVRDEKVDRLSQKEMLRADFPDVMYRARRKFRKLLNGKFVG
jgi:hypothetical protein